MAAEDPGLIVGHTNTDEMTVLAGYDFMQASPVASIGWSDSKAPAAAAPPLTE